MMIDPNNPVVKLCAQGMQKENEGLLQEAAAIFDQAWKEAENDFEKSIAAHYVARHQPDISGKLKWDLLALDHARLAGSDKTGGFLPSLYLNIGKGYEDLKQYDEAREHYGLARALAANLPEDGYGNMIREGIRKGLERISGE